MSSIIKVNTVQDVDGNNIINENANTITIGASGDTISIPAGATLANNGTASGFGLEFQSVQTTGFTASAGKAYPCNTTSSAFTATLPASPSVGDQVLLMDYAGTWDTNNLTINPNGSNILGQSANAIASKDREAITVTFIDATQGWLPSSGYQEGTAGLGLPYTINYLVIAGGGGGGDRNGGGGGAGGFISASSTVSAGTAYTVTVGAGGAKNDNDGTVSSLGSIVSATGGGAGSHDQPASAANTGGSGGGGGGGEGSSAATNGAAGTPGQGNAGGNGSNTNSSANRVGGGGGGAGAVGAAATSNNSSGVAGAGGAGSASSISGSSVTYAGGGGGGCQVDNGTASGGAGGSGGGGTGALYQNGPNTIQNSTAGGANTGGGGGGGARQIGSQPSSGYTAQSGGSGVVIISYSGAQRGTGGSVTSSGGNTIHTFTSSGTYTG